MSDFQAKTSLINRDLANRSHAFTSFDPERRAEQEISGFAAEVQAVCDEVSGYAKTEAQKAFLTDEMTRFQSGYAQKYNEYLGRHGRCVSSFIVGGSGFPVRQAEKAQNSLENKMDEMQEFKQRAKAAMIRELKKLAVDEGGGEIEVLKRKIADAEALQESMKLCNLIIRQPVDDEEKKNRLIGATHWKEETIIKILTPDFCGRVGFTYQLSNNGANIRRMQDRLFELQAKETRPTSVLTFPGGQIIDNAESDRVQIIHAEKPTQEVIDKLKAEGWRWSPAGRCWQRKRTEAAMMSAKRITGAV